MSLILDALRKSEAERRRGKSPDLFASLPAPTASRRPELLRLWPWFALAALGLVAVSVFWIARKADAPPVVAPTQQVVADDQPAAMATAVDAWAAPSATPAPMTTPMQASAPPPPPGPQAAPANAVAAPMPIVPPPPAAVAPTAPATIAESPGESLPPIAVLTASERASLPPLKLSMHVWDSEPAKRFAIIDGHRLGEGAVVGNGVIEEIRRDGVVLDIGGRRILLPRP